MQDDDLDKADFEVFEEELDENTHEEIFEEESSQNEASLETISLADIPIKINLEVSRFEVTLDELSRMEPGYKLPIEINPRIVHLTTGGKIIGKGEIIEIGDTIGVKILELYK